MLVRRPVQRPYLGMTSTDCTPGSESPTRYQIPKEHKLDSTNSQLVYVVVGALAVGVAVLGYLYFQDQRQETHIEVSVDDDGLTIDGN